MTSPELNAMDSEGWVMFRSGGSGTVYESGREAYRAERSFGRDEISIVQPAPDDLPSSPFKVLPEC